MQIQSLDSKIFLNEPIPDMLSKSIENMDFSTAFLLMDTHTEKLCYPLVAKIDVLKNSNKIIVKPGEENKTIKTTEKIWHYLSTHDADRHSVLFIIGGGVLCDMGGFSAATFKRGINFVSLPTTLLAQVDASIGGKLGIDSKGLKNEIGLFKTPLAIIIHPDFLRTLDNRQLLSGFAEMVKHALVYGGENLSKLRQFDILHPDFERLAGLISKSIFIKNDIIHSDPKEKNVRKALNFGHTFGHAFETLMLRKKTPILHGFAVAHGMIAELLLSAIIFNFPQHVLIDYMEFILGIYEKLALRKEDFPEIKELMLHDKKNRNGKINFTLLRNAGEFEINVHPESEQIEAAYIQYIETLES